MSPKNSTAPCARCHAEESSPFIVELGGLVDDDGAVMGIGTAA